MPLCNAARMNSRLFMIFPQRKDGLAMLGAYRISLIASPMSLATVWSSARRGRST